MYTPLGIKAPSDEDIIWRYMSPDRYVDLLKTNRLYLCRIDRFEDVWEGGWTNDMRIFLSARKMDEGFINLVKVSYFASCWHLNENESAGMWDLYSKRDKGIAIKTTVLNLKNALKDASKDFRIGKVNYDFYTKGDRIKYFTTKEGKDSFTMDVESMLDRIPFFKRKAFEHEKELRLVERIIPKDMLNLSNASNYSYADINLHTLIQEIYLAPLINDKIKANIYEISKAFGINENIIRQSDLYTPPIYK